jgi:ectoine hydroxylase-related dioxygenase (phytanoyl-CoA dioxygenase family)
MTTERAKFFREHGWLKVDNLFTQEEVEQLRRELVKLSKQGVASNNYEFDARVQANPDLKHYYMAEVCEPSRFDPFFRRFVTSEKIGALMREILGVPRVRMFRDLGLFKAPANDGGLGTGLHQDLPFYPLDRGGVAAIWIALSDLPANAGTMRFVDGSHKWGPVGRVHVSIEKWLAEHPDQAHLLTPPPALNAGGVTIHDGLMLHGSDPSTWDQPRIGYSISYFRADALFNAMPTRFTVGLEGLKQDEPLDHEAFPLVA